MFQLLNKDELYDVHTATLEILDRIGIFLDEPKALETFKQAGADINLKSKIVRIPPYLVDEGVKRIPTDFILGARNKQFDLHIKKGKVFTRPGSGYTHIIDVDTGQFRMGTIKDTEDSTRLIDALDNISYCTTNILPSDVPSQITDVYAVKIALENTEKHLFISPLTYENFTSCVKMAFSVRKDEEFRKRPLISFIAATTSPLMMVKEVTRQIMDCAKYKIPVMLDSSPMPGATGPITLIGSLVLQNAEDLALNTLIQLISPNSPVIYGPRCAPLDMRTGFPSWGSAETALLSAAGVQIAHYYGMPTDTHGPTTNSKILDEQAGYEKSLCALLPALAGSEIVSGAGAMECLTTSSLEQLVIDNEFFGMMFRILKGITVDKESLAINVIEEVGPGGDFMGQKHTREFYKREHHLGKIFDVNSRDAWQNDGAKDVVKRSKEQVKAILAEHQPTEIDRDVKHNLESILEKAKTKITKK